MANNLRPQLSGGVTLLPSLNENGAIVDMTASVGIAYINNASDTVVTLQRPLALWETLTTEQKDAANTLIVALMQRVNTELL
jgi:hypothetical protein